MKMACVAEAMCDWAVVTSAYEIATQRFNTPIQCLSSPGYLVHMRPRTCCYGSARGECWRLLLPCPGR